MDRIHAFAMASILHAHGATVCMLHLARPREDLDEDSAAALHRFKSYCSEQASIDLSVVTQDDGIRPMPGDVVDVTLGATYAHASFIGEHVHVTVTACDMGLTRVVRLNEGAGSRTTSAVEPLSLETRLSLDDVQYQINESTEPDVRALTALHLLLQRVEQPCFALRDVIGGALVTLDTPWSGRTVGSGTTKVVVSANASNRVLSFPNGGPLSPALTIHDPHDGGFWLEDIMNILAPIVAHSSSARILRNLIIPHERQEVQRDRGLHRMLQQRPNNPDLRQSVGRMLGHDPWHRVENQSGNAAVDKAIQLNWKRNGQTVRDTLHDALMARGGRNEIDLVLAHGGSLIPIELKHKRPTLGDVQKLMAVARSTGKLRPTHVQGWLWHTFRPEDPEAWMEETALWMKMYPGLKVEHVFDDVLPNLSIKALKGENPKRARWRFPRNAWDLVPQRLSEAREFPCPPSDELRQEMEVLHLVLDDLRQQNVTHFHQFILGVDLLSNSDELVLHVDEVGWQIFKRYALEHIVPACERAKRAASLEHRQVRVHVAPRPEASG